MNKLFLWSLTTLLLIACSSDDESSGGSTISPDSTGGLDIAIVHYDRDIREYLYNSLIDDDLTSEAISIHDGIGSPSREQRIANDEGLLLFYEDNERDRITYFDGRSRSFDGHNEFTDLSVPDVIVSEQAGNAERFVTGYFIVSEVEGTTSGILPTPFYLGNYNSRSRELQTFELFNEDDNVGYITSFRVAENYTIILYETRFGERRFKVIDLLTNTEIYDDLYVQSGTIGLNFSISGGNLYLINTELNQLKTIRLNDLTELGTVDLSADRIILPGYFSSWTANNKLYYPVAAPQPSIIPAVPGFVDLETGVEGAANLSSLNTILSDSFEEPVLILNLTFDPESEKVVIGLQRGFDQAEGAVVVTDFEGTAAAAFETDIPASFVFVLD